MNRTPQTQASLEEVIKSYLLIRKTEYAPPRLKRLSSLIMISNYIQIIYEFGIDILLMLLEIMDTYEQYLESAKIYKTILDYNKMEGTSFPTTYINYDEQIERG